MRSKRRNVVRLCCSPLLLVVGFWVAGIAAADAPRQIALGTGSKAVAENRVEATTRANAVSGGETYQGIPVGITADGHPFRGNPDATVTLIEYTDYVCPFCARYFQQTLPTLLEKYGRSGKVKFVIADFPLESLHPTAPKGAAAAACVTEQGAARFWEAHDALFRRQQEWNRLPDPAVFLTEVAKKTGVDMKAYSKCMASDRVHAEVRQRVAAAQALGFTGTPSFRFVQQTTGKTYTLVGAQAADVFTAWIDAMLAGKEPPQPEQAAKPELPSWAKVEGLRPDPKRPGYTVSGDPYKGNADAKVVMIEFGDFECPACQRHALETQPALDKQFVDTGEVMWVVKHFPLRMHPRAPVAAAASECAGDQGRFWAMHHLLFERMERWSAGGEPDRTFRQLAAELEIDNADFAACLASRQALERVLRDLYDGQGIGVRNMPTFIVLYGGTGHVLTGTRATADFAATLQQQIETAKAQAKGEGALARQ